MSIEKVILKIEQMWNLRKLNELYLMFIFFFNVVLVNDKSKACQEKGQYFQNYIRFQKCTVENKY